MPPTDEPTLGLHGRVALITGGSRGLGRAIARKLCVHGCDVVVNYGHADADAEATLRLLDGLPGGASLAKADLSRPDALADVVDEVAARTGRLDIVVHNAASFHAAKTTAAAVDDVHRDIVLAIDPLLAAADRLATLLPPGRGRIIAISGNDGRQVVPHHVGLGAAKAALESVVRYLAVDFAPLGVSVNAVASARLDQGIPGDLLTAALARRAPAGRIARPEDVADVVALLCTDEAAFVQGQVITVDGGLCLRA
jgi:enoyl-[acyl-carrier protein] reductase III